MMDELTGKVELILFPKAGQAQPENGYAIVRVKSAGAYYSAKGSMPGVRTGINVRLTGFWSTDKYGKTFVAKGYEEVLPASEDGIVSYLASGLIKGIGPKLAEKIVDTFGKDTLDILDNAPERLYEVPGIGKKKAGALVESWTEQKGIRDVMIFLKTYGVGNATAAKIFRKYGCRSIPVMKENPYVLADEVEGIGFLTADAIALSMGLARDGADRIRCAMLYAARESSMQEGHVYLPDTELVRRTVELLNHGCANEDAVPEELVAGRLQALTGSGELVSVRFGDENDVYVPDLYAAETSVCARLKSMASEKRDSVSIDFGPLEESCGLTFDDVQKDAINTVFSNRLSIITGGPGTGKTTTMKGVILHARKSGDSVLLAAPTGRAAKRLSETTGMEAQTIHRLLEMNPESGFGKGSGCPLAGDLLVVDESSMIDLQLMESLLESVPEDMRVVFVGDMDQLPSVGAGNVLRDMIDSGIITTVRLTKIFRQAQNSLIVWNAHRINRGEAPSLPCNITENGENFNFVECNDAEKILTHVKNLVGSYLPDTFGVAKKDIQVLSPMRKGPLGVDNLNRILQELENPSAECIRRGDTEFRRGDRVMQMKNNYDWNVFNGDIGTVVDIDTEDRTLTIDFDGNIAVAESPDLEDLSLAYASTVHKSQGSEYPVVVMIVTMAHYMMLMRNLLYTAITRARRQCIIIGERKAVMAMVGNNTVRKRNSRLSERLGRN